MEKKIKKDHHAIRLQTIIVVTDASGLIISCIPAYLCTRRQAASICVEDTISGAYMNEAFQCDANLDGVLDVLPRSDRL